MTFSRQLGLSVLTGILLFLSWPSPVIPWLYVPILLFVAFVPLLILEESCSKQNKSGRLFILSYLAFFIWNVTTTFWVCNASIGGGAAAIFCNSLLMAMVFQAYHVVKSRLAGKIPVPAHWIFPFFWIAFEHFHLRWELTWPWLTLGNAWAGLPAWVQWYEFTGHLGGSAWVLAVNLLLFEWLKGNHRKIYAAGIAILLPLAGSFGLYFSYEEKGDPIDIVVVQPNIDPYSEKFSGLNFEEQLHKMLDLARQKTDSNTDYLIFPETALTEEIWDNDFQQSASYDRLKKFLKEYPRLRMIVGAATWHLYDKGETLSPTARKFKNMEGHYDAFNTAFQIDSGSGAQVYHKSKLVPGVERMPYPALFGFLEDLAIDLGGTAGSLGTQEDRAVFRNSFDKSAAAPVICYESIFGEFVTDYVKSGANFIAIITNDGWWGETPGYKQHLVYGQLRAIETRRSIARSANTGISCFIDQRGEPHQLTEWWKPAVIREIIHTNDSMTLYSRIGDVPGYIALLGSGFFLALFVFFRFRNRRIS